MGMKQTLDILNGLVAAGVVTRYAVGGAIAAYNYIEATVTEDVDILVSFEGAGHQLRSGLVTLGPIVAHLAAKGYAEFNHEGVVIEGWPVQFLPVADALDAEALAQAAQVEVTINPTDGSVSTYILKAEHVVATALKVGRPKAPEFCSSWRSRRWILTCCAMSSKGMDSSRRGMLSAMGSGSTTARPPELPPSTCCHSATPAWA